MSIYRIANYGLLNLFFYSTGGLTNQGWWVLLNGGESGIRTRGTIACTHAFQACAFDHSAISPHIEQERGDCTKKRTKGKSPIYQNHETITAKSPKRK
jgi:hypothetical protein